ncbi:hypothetical protein MA16_Dca011877 [Dendrobium catenatum]|uniref:Uncharacterized protein n=1 Tax=Dendrobium catenatum TaxID=906689 RepID=A0A2I0WED7_9ASPA|nr:hypothetical protein MA16_Dca011877 [Dendrobium catenatum]
MAADDRRLNACGCPSGVRRSSAEVQKRLLNNKSPPVFGDSDSIIFSKTVNNGARLSSNYAKPLVINEGKVTEAKPLPVDKGCCSPKTWDGYEKEEIIEEGSSNIKFKLAKDLRSLGPIKLLPRGRKLENELKMKKEISSPFVP